VLLCAQYFPLAGENRSEDDIAVMSSRVMTKTHFLIQCTLQCSIFLNNLWMPSLAQINRDTTMPVGPVPLMAGSNRAMLQCSVHMDVIHDSLQHLKSFQPLDDSVV